MIQKPASSSLVAPKGPFMTVRPLPSYLTRKPFELACRPSAASNTPAFIISSLNRPMASTISFVGSTPASESLLALTSIMNRIAVLLRGGSPSSVLYLTTIELAADRQPPRRRAVQSRSARGFERRSLQRRAARRRPRAAVGNERAEQPGDERNDGNRDHAA